MKTISVQLSEIEYDALGVSKDRFFFSEIADLVGRQIMRKNSIAVDEKLEKFKQITENLRKLNDEEPLSVELDEIFAQRVNFKDIIK